LDAVKLGPEKYLGGKKYRIDNIPCGAEYSNKSSTFAPELYMLSIS